MNEPIREITTFQCKHCQRFFNKREHIDDHLKRSEILKSLIEKITDKDNRFLKNDKFDLDGESEWILFRLQDKDIDITCFDNDISVISVERFGVRSTPDKTLIELAFNITPTQIGDFSNFVFDSVSIEDYIKERKIEVREEIIKIKSNVKSINELRKSEKEKFERADNSFAKLIAIQEENIVDLQYQL